jgi:glycogen debranching enzyme
VSTLIPVAQVRPEILYAWKGPSLLVVNPRGDCDEDRWLSGFYHREARFIRTLRLRVNGEAPWLCESATVAHDELAFTYAYPEITEPGGGGTGQAGDEAHTGHGGIPERGIDIQLAYRVQVAALEVSVVVANRTRTPIDIEVSLELGADFADIQEAQSNRRQQEAPIEITTHDGIIEYTYRQPQLMYRAAVHPSGGWEAHHGQLRARLTLAPQSPKELGARVVPHARVHTITEDGAAERERVLTRWRRGFARVEVPGNREFERVLADNTRDIGSFPLLDGEPDEWLAMQAGMPYYPAFFGRDAVTAGWQAGYLDGGESLDAALTKLGRLQSDRFDDWRDEQPGRIPYQMRAGPLALLNLNPYSAYYADFASPLMYVMSLANLYAWTGDKHGVRKHWDTARRILDWARDHGDVDRDGYLEYESRSRMGTKNQGWKDSGDAIIYDDGSPVPSPIATCELQAYWYTAQELMALLCLMMGERADAAAYRDSAAALKQRFNRDWWVESERFFALALDPDKQQVRAVTSNVGHCLACGIIDRSRLASVVGRMFAPDLFSGWGVRTLSSDHAFYNPLSYHRGTVWAVEQASIIFGLRRFGFDARALDLTKALFDLALLYPHHRIPECIGGYARGERAVPGAYPRANTPQLWNATAFSLAVQTMLGLLPLAPLETLVLDPVLPHWIPELVLHDLRVGRARVTLRFWRNGSGHTKWDVLHSHGTLRIVRQPPFESVTAGYGERARDLLETVWH